MYGVKCFICNWSSHLITKIIGSPIVKSNQKYVHQYMFNAYFLCQLILQLISYHQSHHCPRLFDHSNLVLELPYCCPIHAKMAVAGAPGGPVHVFGREAKPGIALLCQARRLHQHPPKARLTEFFLHTQNHRFFVLPKKRPSQPPRQALQAAGSAPQKASLDLQCRLSIL